MHVFPQHIFRCRKPVAQGSQNTLCVTLILTEFHCTLRTLVYFTHILQTKDVEEIICLSLTDRS